MQCETEWTKEIKDKNGMIRYIAKVFGKVLFFFFNLKKRGEVGVGAAFFNAR
jgi:hypothetical protein